MGAKSCACTCSPTDETFRMVRRHEYMAKLVAELDSYTRRDVTRRLLPVVDAWR